MQTMERQPSPRCTRKSRRPAPWPVEFYRSAVGKKWVMALTGIMLMGFVFVHMFGNLKVYLGAEDINHYGELLRELLVPLLPRTVTLWLLRIGLAAAFVFHIHSAYGLTPDEPPGPRRRGLRLQARLAGGQRRQPLDALHGRGRPAVPDLPPGRPDLGHGQPRLRAGRRLPQPGGQLRAARGGRHLHRRQHRPRPAPVPRRLVDVPEPGAQQPQVELVAAGLRHRRSPPS